MSSNHHFTSFLQEMDVNWRKMLIFPHRRALAGFTYWTSVRWPVVIFSWHRYQFNCKEIMLLSHFAELDYHENFWIYHCLNLVDIFLFFTRNGHLLAEINFLWLVIVWAKYDSKTIVLYIKQKPKALATIYKKTHVDMIISVDMKTIQSSGIKKNTLYI